MDTLRVILVILAAAAILVLLAGCGVTYKYIGKDECLLLQERDRFIVIGHCDVVTTGR